MPLGLPKKFGIRNDSIVFILNYFQYLISYQHIIAQSLEELIDLGYQNVEAEKGKDYYIIDTGDIRLCDTLRSVYFCIWEHSDVVENVPLNVLGRYWGSWVVAGEWRGYFITCEHVSKLMKTVERF